MNYVDRFGKEIKVGSKVIYTTNSRDSGLSYGLVLDIYEKQNSASYTNHKIKLRALDNDGNEVHEQDIVWNVPGDYQAGYQTIQLDRLVRPSIVDYAEGKFLVLE